MNANQMKTTARIAARAAVTRYGVYHDLPKGMADAVGDAVDKAVAEEIARQEKTDAE